MAFATLSTSPSVEFSGVGRPVGSQGDALEDRRAGSDRWDGLGCDIEEGADGIGGAPCVGDGGAIAGMTR
jgi:hypothetical protein